MVYEDDFFAVIMCGLKSRGHTRFKYDATFNQAMLKAWEVMEKNAETRFRIAPHPIHGDSNIVYAMIIDLSMYGLIDFQRSQIELTFNSAFRAKILAKYSWENYEDSIDAFVESYYNTPTLVS